MPDFNPDKERGQGEVIYAVRNSQKGIPVKEVRTGAGTLKMDKLGRCIVKDPVLAHEIMKDHPRDLVVSRLFRNAPADRGHKYFFGQMPEMPWKKKEQEPQDEAKEQQDDQDND
jgi:hypothetical protein